MCCGCGTIEWVSKPIYARAWESTERYFCEDTLSIWRRIYCADLKGRAHERIVAYMYLSGSTNCSCTCGTCYGWRN